jgi:mRNA interferase MazF
MAGAPRWSVVIVEFDPAVGHEQAGQRRALVVSYEPFHRSGMAAVCPITSRSRKYPGEIPIPVGQAGHTLDGLVLVHQVRTIDLRRITAFQIGGVPQVISDAGVRRDIRRALAHHFGLDVPAAADGAA